MINTSGGRWKMILLVTANVNVLVEIVRQCLLRQRNTNYFCPLGKSCLCRLYYLSSIVSFEGGLNWPLDADVSDMTFNEGWYMLTCILSSQKFKGNATISQGHFIEKWTALGIFKPTPLHILDEYFAKTELPRQLNSQEIPSFVFMFVIFSLICTDMIGNLS